MAGPRDSTSLELSPAAAAIIASAAKELAEQQSMNEALESQIQEGVQELLRVRQNPSYFIVLSSCLNILQYNAKVVRKSPIATAATRRLQPLPLCRLAFNHSVRSKAS